jgi:uncharacterized repeat protein (TIGR03803 family)
MTLFSRATVRPGVAFCVCFATEILVACGSSSQLPSRSASPQASLNQSPFLPRSVPQSSSIYRVISRFGGKRSGSLPIASLTYLNGRLYGTTQLGGASENGTVFKVDPYSGKEVPIYSFTANADGAQPTGALISVGNALYGTTYYGGAYNQGTVFSITTSGKEKVLYSFGGQPDGEYPFAGMINVGGVLYGTTYQGGAYNNGTVFTVTPSGGESILYSFGGSPDGANPRGGVTDVNGTLYGTTETGGTYNVGTVFSFTTSGSESVLHSFGVSSDGAYPYAGVVDVDGTLYGTTDGGGTIGEGTIYTITASGSEAILHSFPATRHDGTEPTDTLTEVNGVLYGTTWAGGGTQNRGIIFAITPSGSESILHIFGVRRDDGRQPFASLLNLNGTLYGTTAFGGIPGKGTIFSL